MDGSVREPCGTIRPDVLQIDKCVLRLGSLVTHKCLSPPLPTTYHPSFSILFDLGMGRRSWATREQLNFLHLYIPELPAAKAGTGLNVLYLRVTEKFIEKWDPEVVGTIPQSPEFIREQTVARLNSVRVFFNTLRSHAHYLY